MLALDFDERDRAVELLHCEVRLEKHPVTPRQAHAFEFEIENHPLLFLSAEQCLKFEFCLRHLATTDSQLAQFLLCDAHCLAAEGRWRFEAMFALMRDDLFERHLNPFALSHLCDFLLDDWMIASQIRAQMKNKKTTAPAPAKLPMTRTVKISDVLHHRIRVLSVQKRMPMQEFIEGLLNFGLKEKAYEKFDGQSEAVAAA